MLKEESSGEPITRFGGACGLLEVSHDVANGFFRTPHACRLVGSNIRDGASVACTRSGPQKLATSWVDDVDDKHVFGRVFPIMRRSLVRRVVASRDGMAVWEQVVGHVVGRGPVFHPPNPPVRQLALDRLLDVLVLSLERTQLSLV